MSDSNGSGNGDGSQLIPATFTPFCGDATIDYAAIPAYANYLRANGIQAVFINGTTGESLSLTVDERMKLLETWQEHASGLRIITHVGHNCLSDCVRLAQHADEVGVHAISTMSTTFFHPRNLDDLVAFAGHVAAAAPRTKFYYYHMPSMTGVSADMGEFISRAVEQIATFAGVKYTHDDLIEFAECRSRWQGRIQIFFGRDELLLPAISVGATGAVGSFYGLMPEVFFNIWRAVGKNDMQAAREWSLYSNRVINICKKVGVPAAGKFLLARKGICGEQLRLPLRSLDSAKQQWLIDQIESVPLPSSSNQASVKPPKSAMLRDGVKSHPVEETSS
jgi:N-acetylneuraminate lyase